MTTSESPRPASEPARFIVGMPRAATTWLCKCFNEHPHTAAFGESMFFGRRYLSPRADGTYSPQQLDTLAARLADGSCLQSVRHDGPGNLRQVHAANLHDVILAARGRLSSAPTPAEVFTAFSQAIAEAEGKHAAVEKTPHHLNWLDRILSAYPDARVVCLLREPYAFMLSYKHQGDRKSEQLRRTLARLYHPLACALIWRASMRSALAARASWPEQVHLVEQESLKHNVQQVLVDVQRFFGLEPVDLASRVPPDNTSFPHQPRPHLQAEDVFWMNLIAGRTIKRAGYERQRVSMSAASLLRIGWSILRLPIWAVGSVLIMRHKVDDSLTRYVLRWFRPARASAAADST